MKALLWTVLLVGMCAASYPTAAAPPGVSWYRLRSASAAGHSIDQGSDLCYGRLGNRDGLWTVCDRNGGKSAGRIYRFSPASLAAAKPAGEIVAAEEIVIVPPTEGWSAFEQTHQGLGKEVLTHLRTRVAVGTGEAQGTALDLEAIAIGLGPTASEPHLFVVAEEPYSLVIELRLGEAGSPTQADVVAAYRYHERDDEHGTDLNDGLEGLAYAGRPGCFWFAEEGTRLHKPDAHPRLFFADPRLGIAMLNNTDAKVDDAVSDLLTREVRKCRDAKESNSQTLNALCLTADGRLLAVDRNGGCVLQIDPRRQTAQRWFSFIDKAGIDLREQLADFPATRQLPYVSMEGIAVDEQGNIWMIDDPAMPESFRESCLVRIDKHLLPPNPSRTATAPN